VNHQLESRLRETRLSGSEGGGVGCSPYPYHIGNFARSSDMSLTLSD
jgi:hypothetical protein